LFKPAAANREPAEVLAGCLETPKRRDTGGGDKMSGQQNKLVNIVNKLKTVSVTPGHAIAS